MLKHQPETLEINDCRRGMNERKGFKKSFKTSHVVAMLNMIRICFSLLLTAVTKEGYEVRFSAKEGNPASSYSISGNTGQVLSFRF